MCLMWCPSAALSDKLKFNRKNNPEQHTYHIRLLKRYSAGQCRMYCALQNTPVFEMLKNLQMNVLRQEKVEFFPLFIPSK